MILRSCLNLYVHEQDVRMSLCENVYVYKYIFIDILLVDETIVFKSLCKVIKRLHR